MPHYDAIIIGAGQSGAALARRLVAAGPNSFLGLEGDEVIHSVLDIMYAKRPYPVIRRAMHIHPTVSEYIPTMLENLKSLRWSAGGQIEPRESQKLGG
jgi:pyruvate/2-oxoglutarate dehydrogenase complex dihydrolipoamide dehydrogenase (E3) component